MYDKDKGYYRKGFSYAEHLRRANNNCLQACMQHEYQIEFEAWADFIEESFISLQIAFEDFTVLYTEEYPACNFTCIIGEVGGNLGFFLGGSILLGVDIILGWITKVASKISRRR